jgi:hypothetical protein
VKAAAALLIVLALLGAAGLSSLQGDDFCDGYPLGTTKVSSEVTAWPPGWRCVYESADGRAVVDAGSVPWFLVALAGEALVLAWALRRRSPSARLALAATVAVAAVGGCGLIGGFGFAFVFGCVLGVPLAWLTDVAFARLEDGRRSRRRSLTAAMVGGLAVFATAVLASVWPAVPAAIVVVAVVGAVGTGERQRQQVREAV